MASYRNKWRLSHAFVKVQREQALRDQGGICLYCREPLKKRAATREHRKARKNGGTDAQSNIGASCADCNRLKGHMTEGAFKKRIKRPVHGDVSDAWLAWSRRRINLAIERMDKHLAAATGRDLLNEQPVRKPEREEA